MIETTPYEGLDAAISELQLHQDPVVRDASLKITRCVTAVLEDAKKKLDDANEDLEKAIAAQKHGTEALKEAKALADRPVDLGTWRAALPKRPVDWTFWFVDAIVIAIALAWDWRVACVFFAGFIVRGFIFGAHQRWALIKQREAGRRAAEIVKVECCKCQRFNWFPRDEWEETGREGYDLACVYCKHGVINGELVEEDSK